MTGESLRGSSDVVDEEDGLMDQRHFPLVGLKNGNNP